MKNIFTVRYPQFVVGMIVPLFDVNDNKKINNTSR